MLQLIYLSRQQANFGPADLQAIVASAVTNNRRLDVTGVLMAHEGFFLQVLEGRRAVVQGLYSVIRCDPRHRDCTLLLETPIQQRQFPDWHMMLLETPDSIAQLLDELGTERSGLSDPGPAQAQLCRAVVGGLLLASPVHRLDILAGTRMGEKAGAVLTGGRAA